MDEIISKYNQNYFKEVWLINSLESQIQIRKIKKTLESFIITFLRVYIFKRDSEKINSVGKELRDNTRHFN